MNVLPGSTNSIGWQLSFVVKNAENNVCGNNAATQYTNRANMIPPLRILCLYRNGFPAND